MNPHDLLIVIGLTLAAGIVVLLDNWLDSRKRPPVDPFRRDAPNDGNLLLLRMRAKRHAMGAKWAGHKQSTHRGNY